MNRVVSLLELVYQAMFVGLVALLPVVFIPVPWATLLHAKVGLLVVLAGIGVIAFVLAKFLQGSLSFPKSFVVFASMLLPLSYLASALATGSTRYSLVGTGVDSHTVVMMFFWAVVVVLAAMVFRGRTQLIRIQYAFLVSAGLVIIFQLIRLFFGPEVLNFGLFTGPSSSVIGGWHDLGIFLGLAAFFSAALLSFANQSLGSMARWGSYAVFALSLFLLVVINTFDVWVGLAALSLAAIVFNASRWMKSDGMTQSMGSLIKNMYLFVIMGALGVLFMFFGTTIHDSLPEKIRIANVEVRPSWTGTLEVASQTLEGRNAIFGSGPNTFVRQWGLYKPSGVNETAFWNADFNQGIGFIPTSIIVIGILGGIAWVLFLLGVVVENGRTLMRSSPDVQPFIASLAAGVVYLWVLAIVYPPGVVLLTLAFLFTGALVGWGMHTGSISTYARPVSDVPRVGFVWSVFLVVVVVLTLFVSGLVLRTLMSDMLVNKGISTYNTSQDIAASRASIERALRIDGGNDRAHRAAIELGIIQITNLAASANPEDEAARAELMDAISTAIQHGLTAVEQDKKNYQNWMALARIYEQLVGAQVEGAYESAEKAYQQAIMENPTNPLFHLRLAQLTALKNDVEATEGHLRQSLALKPNFAEALFMLAQLEAVKGNADAAIAASLAAARALPQEPVIWFQLGTLLFQTQKYTEAAQALEQAVLLNGNYANALYLLSLAYQQLDKKPEAIAAMKRVLELNPGNTQVEEAIKALEAPPAKPAAAKTR